MPKEEGTQTPAKPFKEYAPGFVHVDVKYLPQLPDQDQRTYLFKRLIDQAPFSITQMLTDNGKEFTDCFCATGDRQATGTHTFNRVCTDNRIEHRLTKPRSPQTNGMIERFNGRIADVLRTHRFDFCRLPTDHPQTLRLSV